MFMKRKETLSVRQEEVLKLYALGKKESEISELLCIKKTSVKTHRIRACKKLGVHTVMEALKEMQSKKISIETPTKSKKQALSTTKTIENKKNKDMFPTKINRKYIHLTNREVQILHYISIGFSNAEIAEELFISHYTVETHRKNIIRKMGKRNIMQVLRYAFVSGILT